MFLFGRKQMKRVIVSLLAATCLSTVAMAADLPSRRTVAPAYIPPVFTWTGFYAGVNAGYAFNNDDKINSDNYYSYYAPYQSSKSDDGSFTGGAQIGYNYQMGSVVFGIEADFNFADLKRESTTYDNYVNGYGQFEASSKVEWFGTVRPRVGFTPVDRLLVYVTGGLAYGQVKTSGTYYDYAYNGGVGYGQISKDDTRVGWTVGAGAEYAITDNLTVKGEYLYVDLGDKTARGYAYRADGQPVTLSIKDETNFHVVRAGLNYKF